MRKHTFKQMISAMVAAGLTAGELESRIASIMTEVRHGKAKHAKSKRAPLIKPHSRSKYMPHQGARECARRRAVFMRYWKLFDKNMFSYGPLNRLI